MFTLYIVIVGGGKVGTVLAGDISREGHDVTIIDLNARVLEHIQNSFDVGICQGNGAMCDVQREAEVSRADIFIAVTPTDELNILSCLIAKKMGAKHCVARVRNPDYLSQMDFMSKELGISMIINPENETANEILRTLSFPSAIKVESFAKGRVEMAEVRLSKDNQFISKAVCEVAAESGVKVLICAVERDGDVIIPKGDFVLCENDKLYITASRQALIGFIRKFFGGSKNKLKNVMIIGGGMIGYYLARLLDNAGMKVKVIEKDPKKCEEIAQLLPKVQIIEGDGADEELLLEQGMLVQDALVAVTGMDEENVIISMYADSNGVGKVVCKINRLSSEMIETIGIDCVVSPKNLVTDHILRYVRATDNTEGSGIQTLYRFADGNFEALEFIVEDSFEGIGKQLKDLDFEKGVLIACISRQGKIIFPSGSDTIEEGDSVIVVTASSQMNNLNDILA